MQCKICQSQVQEVGKKIGCLDSREFTLLHCPQCNFSFVANPRLDFEEIYSESYYRGYGADPYVDYVYELEYPDLSIRTYEWQGILKVIKSLFPKSLNKQIDWLDYGYGNGGLVRYVNNTTNCKAIGYDEGWIVKKAQEYDIPVTHQLDQVKSHGKFDIVTAIEVLEHVEDPLNVLREIRSMLKPNGLFFYTTGNAFPHRKKILNWRYFIPEIHISLYEPETLAVALKKTAFRVGNSCHLHNGWSDILRFKVLKTLGVRKRNTLERMAPWNIIAPLISVITKYNYHPVAWAEGDE